MTKSAYDRSTGLKETQDQLNKFDHTLEYGFPKQIAEFYGQEPAIAELLEKNKELTAQLRNNVGMLQHEIKNLHKTKFAGEDALNNDLKKFTETLSLHVQELYELKASIEVAAAKSKNPPKPGYRRITLDANDGEVYKQTEALLSVLGTIQAGISTIQQNATFGETGLSNADALAKAIPDASAFATLINAPKEELAAKEEGLVQAIGEAKKRGSYILSDIVNHRGASEKRGGDGRYSKTTEDASPILQLGYETHNGYDDTHLGEDGLEPGSLFPDKKPLITVLSAFNALVEKHPEAFKGLASAIEQTQQQAR